MNKTLTATILGLVGCLTNPLNAESFDRSEIPTPIYDKQPALVDLYWKTWEISEGRVREKEGIPASPYMDENCYETDIWIWDTVFMSMFTKYSPNRFPGMPSLDNFYYPMYEDAPVSLNIHLRDNPPIFAWVEGDYYDFAADRSRLNTIFKEKQFLQRHFDWFETVDKGHRHKSSQQPVFRGKVADRGFTWTGGASGMDNTPRGRNSGGYDKILWIDAISQQALSARCIADLYQRTENMEQTKIWANKFQQLKNTINTVYWDETDGIYYDINIATGKPDKVLSIASFWPMIAGVADKNQIARMVKYLQDPKQFGGKYALPTLSRQDQQYNDATGDYWRGGIWLPTTYMVIKGLEQYGYFELAHELSVNTVNQQLRTYQNFKPATIWECYSPSADRPSTEHGRTARPDFCGWSSLGPISLFIENIIGIHKVSALKKEIHWQLNRADGRQGIQALKFGPYQVDLIYNGKDRIDYQSSAPLSLIVNGQKLKLNRGKGTLRL